MGKLGAFVAEISVEEGRAEPALNSRALLPVFERLAERPRQRLRLGAWLWQQELSLDAVGASKDQRTKCHIRARRSVRDAEFEIIGLGDVLLLRRREHRADAKRRPAVLLHDVD